MDEIIDNLSIQFSRMTTQEEQVEVLKQIVEGTYLPLAQYRVMRDQSPSGRSTISREAKNRDEDQKFLQALNEMSVQYDFMESLMKVTLERSTGGILHDEDSWSGPLLYLPCANVDLRLHKKCGNPGVHACTGCRLVSYCSAVCQSSHWRKHKKDCKNDLNSADWMPHWIMENRDPSFIDTGSSPLEDGGKGKPAGRKENPWGDVPAINILNLEQNEGTAYKEDLSLCFPASGDLRDVILSINDIPADYPGHISLVINDSNPRIVARNLLILLTIAQAKDTNLAADLALHLWYSAFIPDGYNSRIEVVMTPTLASVKDYRMDWKSDKLRVVCDLSAAVGVHLMSCFDPSESIDPKVAANNYAKMMLSSSRVDSRDSYLSSLKPAHRVALTKYQFDGLLLPFGAANSPFDTPNITLFTIKGEWLPGDGASPLGGWDMSTVLATGKGHGAKEEDLFGCLYFYLSDQLVKFKRQLSRLSVTFYFSNMQSQDLSKGITSNKPLSNTIRSLAFPAGIPTRFDRIHASNTVERGYLGYDRVLADWGPLLNDSNPSATLLSYSKYWTQDHPYQQDEKIERENMHRFVIERGRLIPTLNERKFPHVIRPEVFSVVSFAWSWASSSMYDDSAEFEKYLEAQGIKETMKKVAVQMKSHHTIMPKRHCIPLSAPLATIPIFKNDEHWYTEVLLSRQGFKTRFQEFSRSGDVDGTKDSILP